MAAEPSQAPMIARVASPSHAPARSVDRAFPVGRGHGQHLVLTSMFLAIGAVTGLAWLDSQREAEAALGDVAGEQAVITTLLAANLRARLATVERDAHLMAERGPQWAAGRYSVVAIRAAGASRREPSDRTRVMLTIPLPDG